MSKLYFVEKNSQMNDIADAVAEEGDMFVVVPCISGYKFKYPSNLSYSRIPDIRRQVCYKTNLENSLFNAQIKQWKAGHLEELSTQPIKHLKNIHNYEGREKTKAVEEVKKLFNLNKDWILATDPDRSGTRGFDLFIEIFLGSYLFEFNFDTLKRLNLSALDKNSIKKRMLDLDDINPQTKDSAKKILNDTFKNTYKNKDFFDYSFNINSLLVYGDALKIVGGYNPNVILTHFMIKTLLLVGKEEEISDNQIVYKMDKEGIGSPASRNKILQNIYDMGLIEKRVHKNEGTKWLISKEGASFIDMIHNKINSMQTAEVIKDVEEMKSSDFQDKYSKKLSVFFNKQHKKIKRKMFEQFDSDGAN